MDDIQELRAQLGEVTQDQIEITRNLQSQLAEIQRIRTQLIELQEEKSES